MKSSQSSIAFRLSRLNPPSRPHNLRIVLERDHHPVTGRERPGFEDRRLMRHEQAMRVRSLKRYARQLKQEGKSRLSRQTRLLADRLQRVRRPNDLESFASPLFTREFRRRFFGEVLRLVSSIDPHEVRIYHIAAPKWHLPAAQADRLSPAKLREAFRANLLRAGVASFSGWSIAFFHNEADRTTGSEQPHFHVIVVGEKYRAFEALRKLPMFRGGAGKAVYRPIVVQALTNSPRQISYLFKGYIPETTSYSHNVTGGKRRHQRGRLSEPRHAQSILFLHQQRFSDLIWMHGIEIKDGRLVPTGGHA